MAYNGAYPPGYSAGGLGARGRGHSGEVQLQMPVDFDIDDEVDKLHGKVSMLKKVRLNLCNKINHYNYYN